MPTSPLPDIAESVATRRRCVRFESFQAPEPVPDQIQQGTDSIPCCGPATESPHRSSSAVVPSQTGPYSTDYGTVPATSRMLGT